MSLDFSCFIVFLGSVKNIEERIIHTVPKTVLTWLIIIIKYAHNIMQYVKHLNARSVSLYFILLN
jgi:hypothetical protein